MSRGNIVVRCEPPNFDAVINPLIDKDYLRQQENLYFLTDKANQFLLKYDNIGQQEIFDGNIQMAILEFLYQLNSPIKIDHFPKLILDSAPHTANSMSNELAVMDLLAYKNPLKSYVEKSNANWFKLNENGRKYYEYQIAEREKKAKEKNEPSVLNQYNAPVTNQTSHGPGSHNVVGNMQTLNYENIIKEKDEVIGELERQLKQADIDLKRAQTKEIKNKWIFGAIGVVATYIGTHSKEIFQWLKQLTQ